MPVLNLTEWIILILVSVCCINFFLVARTSAGVRRHKVKIHAQKHQIHELEEDVKALYESASTLGNKLQMIERSHRVLKEQQEQLTLKEPNKQTYRNAIQAINNGDTVNQVAQSSGLSRGEVELLTLLQKINDNTSDKIVE